MKNLFLCMCSVLLFTGCGVVGANSAVYGTVFTKVKSPLMATSNENSTKVGTASAKGILGYAKGDASIEAACKSAGITKIHHIDQETKSFLMIFVKYKVIVYGE